jgi:hypothetical protein
VGGSGRAAVTRVRGAVVECGGGDRAYVDGVCMRGGIRERGRRGMGGTRGGGGGGER